jgi:fructoselysine-6-P-deglycase FrlB-like protein
VRAFVLEGEGPAGERAAAAAEALRELGCNVDLLPTRHPVVDIVLFQRLAVELAERRGREPDRIRRHDPRWAAAAKAAKADNAA